MKAYEITLGNEKVVLKSDARFENQARAVLERVTEVLASTARSPSDGATIDFGWARFILHRDRATWTIREPTFRGDPSANTRDDVSLSLAILFRQVAFAALIGLPPQAASFKETLIYVPKSIDDRSRCMERSAKTQEGDSGWYLGPVDGEPSPSDMVSRYTAELVHVRPAALDVLLLPVGSSVIWDGDEIEALYPPGSQESTWRDSMRAQRAAWPRLPLVSEGQ